MEAPLTHPTLPAYGTLLPHLGGHFAAVLRDGAAGELYALIVAPDDMPEGMPWGPYGEDAPATSITNGRANTDSLLADEREFSAAFACTAFSYAGHADWYLPSLVELATCVGTVPELFSKRGCYWTSTQDSPGIAFVVGFGDGTSNWSDEDLVHRVRAVRRVPLDLLNALSARSADSQFFQEA